MSQDGRKSLLIQGPEWVIDKIELLAKSYNDGCYSIQIEVVQPTNHTSKLALDWKNIRLNIEIPGIVTEVRHDGIWVSLGLPDNRTFFVTVPHVHQRKRLANGTHAKLKVISFNRADQVLNLELLSTSNP